MERRWSVDHSGLTPLGALFFVPLPFFPAPSAADKSTVPEASVSSPTFFPPWTCRLDYSSLGLPVSARLIRQQTSRFQIRPFPWVRFGDLSAGRSLCPAFPQSFLFPESQASWKSIPHFPLLSFSLAFFFFFSPSAAFKACLVSKDWVFASPDRSSFSLFGKRIFEAPLSSRKGTATPFFRLRDVSHMGLSLSGVEISFPPPLRVGRRLFCLPPECVPGIMGVFLIFLSF